MDVNRWQIRLLGTLLGVSVVLYVARWTLFPSPDFHNEMWRFLVGDVAFLFIQVPLVTLLIDRQLQRRQRQEMLTKLNMVIGAFFSETGTDLLGRVASADRALGSVREDLVPRMSWTPAQYAAANRAFTAHEADIDLDSVDLEALRSALADQKRFLLGLLGNQNLLEHETFTDLLWALTHLSEELSARKDLSQLSKPDAAHLAGDIERAYTLLGCQWIDYLAHLQAQYPYLFSLAVRTNPLDPEADPVVTG